MNDAGWTIDELAERAARVLAEAGVQAPNGRVSALPDRRVIRWYATIGLLDPPLRTRGRVARYGERHLLQLVAVKRRQAQGRSLAEVQAELTGATDTTLRRVAGLAEPAGRTDVAPRNPTGLAPTEVQPQLADTTPELPDRDRAGFWRARPAAAFPAPAAPGPVPGPPDPRRPVHSPVRMLDTGHPGATGSPDRPVLPAYLVPLHPDAALQLLAPPTDDDLAAIHQAAQPLLAELAARGLLPPERNVE